MNLHFFEYCIICHELTKLTEIGSNGGMCVKCRQIITDSTEDFEFVHEYDQDISNGKPMEY